MLLYKYNSPIHHKFEELFSQMEKLGISMCVYGMNNIFTFEDKELRIIDADSGIEVLDFPPFCEWRVAVKE